VYREWLRFLAAIAAERGASAADCAAWHAAAGEAAEPGCVDSAAFYACEGQVVAVAAVPLA